jgi:hypothetical protein
VHEIDSRQSRDLCSVSSLTLKLSRASQYRLYEFYLRSLSLVWLTCVLFSLIPGESLSKELLKRLLTIVVYSTDEVVLHWVLKSPVSGEDIKSHPSQGKAYVKEGRGSIQIYLERRYVGSGPCPFELEQQLSALCTIKDPAHRNLVQLILNHDDRDYLHETLDRQQGLRSREEVRSIMRGECTFLCSGT